MRAFTLAAYAKEIRSNVRLLTHLSVFRKASSDPFCWVLVNSTIEILNRRLSHTLQDLLDLA
jgi:hypothetical protein